MREQSRRGGPASAARLVRLVPLAAIAVLALCASPLSWAEEPDPDDLGGGPIPDWASIPAYPTRQTDPAAVERGRVLYELNGCSFCHGKDTRGGDGGPSLLRSQLVLTDQKGERIAGTVLNGVPNTAMVAFTLKPEQIADIAEFLHSFKVSGGDAARKPPPSIVTGNAEAGARFFKEHCSSCHSPDGDLHAVASRYKAPRKLQQRWLMPRNAPPTEVEVWAGTGAPVKGALVTLDEFVVSLTLADGSYRSFERQGSTPKLEVHDPLAGHKALLRTYRDQDIHDVTAFLVTLK
jgi:cytochrome c oxidase cbb3-type subunit III